MKEHIVSKPLAEKTIGEIEKEYKVHLGVRSHMKLNNWLRKAGYPSLARLIEKTAKNGLLTK